VRTSDADTSVKVLPGLEVAVAEGTTNGDTKWMLTTNQTITLGTTALTFAQTNGAGGSLADHNHTGGGDGGALTGAVIDSYMEFVEVAAPSSPAASRKRIYFKSDGKLYKKDSGGAETEIGSGISGTITSGQVARGTGTNTVGGSSNLYFDGANNRLSINQGTSPAAPLHIKADPAGNSFRAIDITDNGGSVTSFWRLTGSEVRIGGGANVELALYANDANRIYGDASGRIGVNKTSSLSAQFHVVSGDAARTGLVVESAAASTVHSAEIKQVASNDAAITSVFVFGQNHATAAQQNFGMRLRFNLKSSTSNDQLASDFSVFWEDPTQASRTSAVAISTTENAATADRLVLRGLNAYFGNGRVSATPESYVLNGTGGFGTDVAGASFGLAAGRPTGAANPGTISFAFARPGTSGGSLQSLSEQFEMSYGSDQLALTAKLKTSTTNAQDAVSVRGKWSDNTHATRTAYASVATVSKASALVDRLIVGAKKTLTDNTTTSIFEIAVPTLKGASGMIEATIFVATASEVQVRSTVVRYSAVNKAGTYTTEIVEVSSALSASTGTLDDTWTILNGTDKVTIQLNANSSLTPTEMYVTFTLKNNSEQAITLL
jgi:hypothetical protein